MTDPAQLVGQRLKTLRAERALTVRDLAHASGLAFNTISLIERSRMSPTIATLHKLASALGVPLAYFVSESQDKQVIFLKRAERHKAYSARVLLENLGVGLPNQSLELLLLTLQVGADSGPDPIVHVGHEFAFCLEGRVEYVIEGKLYELEPEDSLLFEAHRPHCWRNGQHASSRLLLVLQSSEGHEIALRRHLESVGRGSRKVRGGPDEEGRPTSVLTREDLPEASRLNPRSSVGEGPSDLEDVRGK